MRKFTNAYYVSYTFKDTPFLLGPYDIMEKAECAYDLNKSERNIQIIKVQVTK